MDTIGKRMKSLRLEHGLSVRDVAEKTGVPISTYREWEAGRQIKGEPYEKISQALEVTLNELLTGKRSNSREVFIKLQEIEIACQEIKKHLASFAS